MNNNNFKHIIKTGKCDLNLVFKGMTSNNYNLLSNINVHNILLKPLMFSFMRNFFSIMKKRY